MVPGEDFADATGSDLPATTEKVLLTADEFEIATAPTTNITIKVINMTRWDRDDLKSKGDFA